MIISGFLTFSILLILYFIFLLISMITKSKTTKNLDSFECGFESMNFSRLPISISFVIFGLIFVLFDLEILLVLVMNFSFIVSTKQMFLIYLLILFLLFTLLFEWMWGMLTWKI